MKGMQCEILYGVFLNESTYEKCFPDEKKQHFQKIILDSFVLDDKVTLTEDICVRYVTHGQFTNDSDEDRECYVIIGVPLNWMKADRLTGFAPCDAPTGQDKATFAEFIAANPAFKDLKPQVVVYVEQ